MADEAPNGNGGRPATACVLVIGDEVLTGRTKDANLAFLGERLYGLGIVIREARVLPDDIDFIAETVNEVRARYDLVFTTGGIGPTHDDKTARGIARAFGVGISRNKEAERRLLAYYPPERVNEGRMRMADMPDGADLIDNPVSAAPGFRMANVFAMAGIPRIMQAMFIGLEPQLPGGRPLLARPLWGYVREGDVTLALERIQDAHGSVEIGCYPFFKNDRPSCCLIVRGADPADVDAAVIDLQAMIEALGEIAHLDEDPTRSNRSETS